MKNIFAVFILFSGWISSAKAEMDPVVRGAPAVKAAAINGASTKIDMKDAEYVIIRVGKKGDGTLVTASVTYQRNGNCEIVNVAQTENTIEADIIVACGFGFGRGYSEIEIKKGSDTYKVELGVN